MSLKKLTLLNQAEVKPPMDFQHACDSVPPFHTATKNVNTLPCLCRKFVKKQNLPVPGEQRINFTQIKG